MPNRVAHIVFAALVGTASSRAPGEDLKAHQGEIAVLLQRDLDQADALGPQDIPVFLIGPLKVAAVLDSDGFEPTAGQARAKGHP